jgi:ribosome-binding protein aMBF1 (putative translation factor)
VEIIDTYPPDEIGGWRLSETPLRASRRDAAVHLHELARRSRRLSDLDVPAARIATPIASLVTRPGVSDFGVLVANRRRTLGLSQRDLAERSSSPAKTAA